jgi:hypothetical protein
LRLRVELAGEMSRQHGVTDALNSHESPRALAGGAETVKRKQRLAGVKET